MKRQTNTGHASYGGKDQSTDLLNRRQGQYPRNEVKLSGFIQQWANVLCFQPTRCSLLFSKTKAMDQHLDEWGMILPLIEFTSNHYSGFCICHFADVLQFRISFWRSMIFFWWLLHVSRVPVLMFAHLVSLFFLIDRVDFTGNKFMVYCKTGYHLVCCFAGMQPLSDLFCLNVGCVYN